MSYNSAISIHALREEGDLAVHADTSTAGIYFYPRPPRGGRRKRYEVDVSTGQFLSTPSARRATADCFAMWQGIQISIHALREEGDGAAPQRVRWQGQFLSTPSARRATLHRGGESRNGGISIHALREEGDTYSRRLINRPNSFLSTPSARRATKPVMVLAVKGEFLSTPSARRATNTAASSTNGNVFLSTPSARRATTYLLLL